MSTDLTPSNRSTELGQWTDDQLRLIKEQICPDLTDGELSLFEQICVRTGLDPFARQIFAIKRNAQGAQKMTIQVSIDGLRTVAQRSGRYNGQTAPEWYDGEKWVDVWTSQEPPIAARVGVYIKGSDHPTWGIAHFAEYAQKKRDGSLMGLWRTMGANQIAKCAEAQALRKANPADLAGIYTTDEMQQALNPTGEIVDALTDAQEAEALEVAIRAGFTEAAAKRRVGYLRPRDFQMFIDRCSQLADEREQAANQEGMA